MKTTIKLIVVALIAVVSTGCAGYKQQGLTGYEGIAYTRTDGSVAAMNGCKQELIDGHNTVVIRVPDSINITEQRRKKLSAGKREFIHDCMAEKGYANPVII